MAEDSLDALLRFAIANKRLLHSPTQAARVAEPHDYGVHKGVLRLLVFQLRGGSSRASSSRGWKLLDVDKITSCAVAGRDLRREPRRCASAPLRLGSAPCARELRSDPGLLHRLGAGPTAEP